MHPIDIVFTVLRVLGKLICYPREFEYGILVVCMSINEIITVAYARITVWCVRRFDKVCITSFCNFITIGFL